jgi:hypothetical protein
MKEISKKISWEESIIKAIEECEGSATLKEIYHKVPQIRAISFDASKTQHNIRAYLRRMTQESGKLKKIGLGIYALRDKQIQPNLYGSYKEYKEEIIKTAIPDNLHSNVEGMLLELGNIYGYLTYTDDPSKTFNGKKLSDISTIDNFPTFDSVTLSNIAKRIDVIWFEKYGTSKMPKHTFDIEITTDFSKASFYLISKPEKLQQFEKRISMNPFEEIKERTNFCLLQDVFQLYDSAVRHNELKEKIIIEPK